MNRILHQLRIFFVSVALLMAIVPMAAFAHAHLLTSAPAKDSVVHIPPTEVILHFSEALEIAMCKLEVKNLKTGAVVSQGEIANDCDDKSSLKISVKALGEEKSEYEVSWKAVAKDSHRMPGKYKFTFDPKKK